MSQESPPAASQEQSAQQHPQDFRKDLEAAETFREEGNRKFKCNEVQAAKQDYEESLALLHRLKFERDCTGEKTDLIVRRNACQIPVLLNLSLCCLKAEPCEAFRALELCEEALDMEPDNAKAMYRKAKALIELDELKEAEWELTRACKLMPKDAAVRKDLEHLRQRARDMKSKEKATFQGLFSRGPGFASDNRATNEGSPVSNSDLESMQCDYFHQYKDNPFDSSESPHEDAIQLRVGGQLEDAVMAWEGALSQSAARGDWSAHFGHCVGLGRLLMDINVDNLAIRCFNKVIESRDQFNNDVVTLGPSVVRQHALLLRAICLLNEAVGDRKQQVSACLEKWLQEVKRGARAEPAVEEPEEVGPLDARIEQWSKSAGSTSDASVAVGLLWLLDGKEEAPQAFADALSAPEVDSQCFGDTQCRAVKWNMLGAVLANRQRYEHALVAYEQALRLQPHYPRALGNRGISLVERDDPLAGVVCQAAALAIVPSWATESFWPMLQSAAEMQSAVDGLSEAARDKSLSKVRELLGSATDPLAGAHAVKVPVADVLRQLGFVSSASSTF